MIARCTPLHRTALKRKPRRFVVPPEVLAYWEWIREQPCVVPVCCGWWRPMMQRRIEVAHVGMRGLGQKSDPMEVIPLCRFHHGREFPYSHHVLGKLFWKIHNLDRYALIRRFKTQYFGLTGIVSSRPSVSVRQGGVPS